MWCNGGDAWVQVRVLITTVKQAKRMTKLFLGLATALALMACDTPKVGFKYTDVQKLSVGGHDFKVFYNDKKAQSIRLNNVKLRQRQNGADAALIAIEQASGCKIRNVDKRTDAVLVIASLRCPM